MENKRATPHVSLSRRFTVQPYSPQTRFKGGVGASPPARGSTPAPRPKLGDYSYSCLLLALSRFLHPGLGSRRVVLGNHATTYQGNQ
jgi:hypothetical protein